MMIVFAANAVVQVFAMMIKLLHASLAGVAIISWIRGPVYRSLPCNVLSTSVYILYLCQAGDHQLDHCT
jgi:hypothetical protein